MSAPRSAPRLHPAAWVEALALAVGLWAVWGYWHDDAFITFRYAERVLDGLGLTWSGTEQVEGYTHPLWLAALVGLGALGAPVPLVGKLLGAASLLALWLAVARRWGSGGLVALSLAGYSVLSWAVSGLETLGFTAVGVGAALALSSGGRWSAWLAGGLAGLAPWVRPEGMVLGPVLAGALVLARYGGVATLARSAADRPANAVLAPWAVGLGALLLARWSLYGQLLPNTALAKLSDEPRLDVLLRGVLHVSGRWPLLAPLLVALAVGLLLRGRVRGAQAARPDDALAAFLALAWGAAIVAMNIWVGGDHMLPPGRLLVPGLVPLAVAIQAGGATLLATTSWPRWALAAATLASAVEARAAWQATEGADLAWVVGRRAGLLLDRELPPGSLVATPTAGSTPYHAPRVDFIDTLGLNDPVIARAPVGELRTRWQHIPGHQRGDGAYVLSREPDLVLIGGGSGVIGNRADEWFLTDLELITSPAFRAAYTPYAIALPADVDPPGYRVAPGTWRLLSSTRAPPPAEVRAMYASGREPMVAWLRNDSPRVGGLRAQGVDLSAWVLPIDELLYGNEPMP